MEQLKSMKETLTTQVHAQLANLEKADYHELGAAIDMIKDMAETEYYCAVVKAMEEAEEEKETRGSDRYYYTERYMPIPYQRVYDRDMDRGYGRMYYNGGNSNGGNNGGNAGGGSSGGSGYSDRSGGGRMYENPRDMGGNDYPRSFYEPPYMMIPPMYESRNSMMLRDPREGRSADRRRMYMESKEMHQGKEKQMQELESYMTELSGDITDMIHGASPEERQMLQKKLSSLAQKIDQV